MDWKTQYYKDDNSLQIHVQFCWNTYQNPSRLFFFRNRQADSRCICKYKGPKEYWKKTILESLHFLISKFTTKLLWSKQCSTDIKTEILGQCNKIMRPDLNIYIYSHITPYIFIVKLILDKKYQSHTKHMVRAPKFKYWHCESEVNICRYKGSKRK